MSEEDLVFAIPCPDILFTGRCNLRCKYCFEHDKFDRDIDGEKLNEYLSHNPLSSAFPFGGEPLLVLDRLINAVKIIEKNPNIPEKRKNETLRKFRHIITNGILLPSCVDKLKKGNFAVQISIDGVKEANDLNRVFPSGAGTYDHIIKAIECCVENNIEWSIHGVIDKRTLPYLFETTKWFFEMYAKYKPNGYNYAVDYIKNNTFQIIFESDYDDDDVDLLIKQFFQIAEWVWNHDKLNQEQKERFFDNFFFKMGGVCGAGTGLLVLDTEFDIYPCHRLAFIDDKEAFKLGNAFKVDDFKNFKLYNSFHKLGKRFKYLYSAITQNHNYNDANNLMWMMWCPATNFTECDNLFFQPVKYNLMFTELNRAIKLIRLSYFGSINPHKTLSERKATNC